MVKRFRVHLSWSARCRRFVREFRGAVRFASQNSLSRWRSCQQVRAANDAEAAAGGEGAGELMQRSVRGETLGGKRGEVERVCLSGMVAGLFAGAEIDDAIGRAGGLAINRDLNGRAPRGASILPQARDRRAIERGVFRRAQAGELPPVHGDADAVDGLVFGVGTAG